jgi:sugar lactone lactonase YvrE
VKRRHFLELAAAVPAAAAAAGPLDLKSIKSRGARKVEIAYKSPHSTPNGLQNTKEGLWVLDETNAPTHWVSLVNFADGKVIREFELPGMNGPSGLTVDANDTMWINSSDNSMIFSVNHHEGKILAKYWAPGASRTFRVKGDPPPATPSQTPAFPRPQAATKTGGKKGVENTLGPGQLPMEATSGAGGLGGQGMEHRDGLLYISTMAARRLFVLDPKTWEVQTYWQLPGNRSHGVGWDGDTLWVADTNLKAFFRHDLKTGDIKEKIQLTDKDPVIHGATIKDGYLWYCDVAGYICNLKL